MFAIKVNYFKKYKLKNKQDITMFSWMSWTFIRKYMNIYLYEMWMPKIALIMQRYLDFKKAYKNIK